MALSTKDWPQTRLWESGAQPSAFLASVVVCARIISQTLPPRLRDVPCQARDAALKPWSEGHEEPPLASPASSRQKVSSQGNSHIQAPAGHSLRASTRARLLAASGRESSVWTAQELASVIPCTTDPCLDGVQVHCH